MGDDADQDEAGAEGAETLSFIDVVSCGLAASLLLFLVYTVLPHVGRSGAIRSTVTSSVAPPGEERNAAGLAKDEKSARLAITVFSVAVHLGSIPPEQVRWKDLPPDCGQYFIRREKDAMFVASCTRGVKPDVVVALELRRSDADASQIRTDPTLFVGGATPIRKECKLSGSRQRFAEFSPSSTRCRVSAHGEVTKK